MRGRAGLGLTFAVLAWLLTLPGPDAPGAEELSTFVWQRPGDPRFGGMSAIDLAADGLGFVAVSDSAAFYFGRLLRGRDGGVVAVKAGRPVRPLSLHGDRLDEWMDDAEGVAFAPGGGLYVSYESHDRIVRYGPGGRDWIEEYWPEAFRSLIINKGIEALAVDAAGRLHAIPEVPPEAGNTPVFRLRGQVLDIPFTLRRDRNWAPVGADFGPDGRLYLLERDYWPLLGFASRVRRIALQADRVAVDEVIWRSEPGRHDNLEGVAAWRDAVGTMRLTLISDDNFLPLQRTELVDLRVLE